MRGGDVVRFGWRSLSSHRARTLLMVLAMAIGSASVVVLTSLGEGARRYVRDQFEALGTNLIVVFPGRAETSGGMGGVLSGRTPRDLTLDDALSLLQIRGVTSVMPLNLVAGEIWHSGRRRDIPVVGSTSELQHLWHLSMAQGHFLEAQDPRRAIPVCVIGSKVRDELFGTGPAVGEWVRIGDRRFRVVGVLAPKGQFVGLDIDELAIIPVTSAQMVFNLQSLLRVAIEVERHEDVKPVRDEVLKTLARRHDGEEDVTVVTEDAVASTFDKILLALTLAIGGIGSISLAVAGILIMNVMLVAVSQRTGEIGLLKAIGASPLQIRLLFIAEAAMLSAVGGVAGLAIGQAGSLAIRWIYPELPAYAPVWAVAASLGVALVTGILFSLLPARRAARLEAAAALARR
ncbi:MAG: ABC transporter permease [Acidobacteria bacterium]|nr:ABC transporter permease [Acidobacteriota bacterium]